jgi:hypothetical protein
MMQGGCEWVQFTATVDQHKTDEVIARNIAAAAPTSDQPTQQT